MLSRSITAAIVLTVVGIALNIMVQWPVLHGTTVTTYTAGSVTIDGPPFVADPGWFPLLVLLSGLAIFIIRASMWAYRADPLKALGRGFALAGFAFLALALTSKVVGRDVWWWPAGVPLLAAVCTGAVVLVVGSLRLTRYFFCRA
jgi:hypothetical protein